MAARTYLMKQLYSWSVCLSDGMWQWRAWLEFHGCSIVHKCHFTLQRAID